MMWVWISAALAAPFTLDLDGDGDQDKVIVKREELVYGDQHVPCGSWSRCTVRWFDLDYNTPQQEFVACEEGPRSDPWCMVYGLVNGVLQPLTDPNGEQVGSWSMVWVGDGRFQRLTTGGGPWNRLETWRREGDHIVRVEDEFYTVGIYATFEGAVELTAAGPSPVRVEPGARVFVAAEDREMTRLLIVLPGGASGWISAEAAGAAGVVYDFLSPIAG